VSHEPWRWQSVNQDWDKKKKATGGGSSQNLFVGRDNRVSVELFSVVQDFDDQYGFSLGLVFRFLS